MGRPRTITQDQEMAICWLYTMGLPQARLARLFRGHSHNTVISKILRRNNIERRTPWQNTAWTKDELVAHLFENRIIRENGCWEWTGCRDKKGYGYIQAKSVTGQDRPVQVSRIAAFLWNGFAIDSELHICHKCDNPPCFCPDHLFESTNYGNVRDAHSKNRMRNQFRHDNEGVERCIHGHAITPENLKSTRNGPYAKRLCLTCERRRDNAGAE